MRRTECKAVCSTAYEPCYVRTYVSVYVSLSGWWLLHYQHHPALGRLIDRFLVEGFAEEGTLVRKSTFCIETVDLEETGNSQKQGLAIAVPNEKSGQKEKRRRRAEVKRKKETKEFPSVRPTPRHVATNPSLSTPLPNTPSKPIPQTTLPVTPKPQHCHSSSHTSFVH
ncbi:hypothetical protein VNO80_03740 [Phaseolus coccineus]|uniref:Uncharacterized protein n=1 Tax=Phaseolus coccineus TaxID=3886 RepID=A0AAN9NS98_PHACN